MQVLGVIFKLVSTVSSPSQAPSIKHKVWVCEPLDRASWDRASWGRVFWGWVP